GAPGGAAGGVPAPAAHPRGRAAGPPRAGAPRRSRVVDRLARRAPARPLVDEQRPATRPGRRVAHDRRDRPRRRRDDLEPPAARVAAEQRDDEEPPHGHLYRIESHAVDVRAVEAALGTALEPTEDQDFDDRTHLRRFRTADGRCVVVKEPRGGARDAFLNEWASLQLLTELAPGVAPRFLGGDRDLGFLIMEDLGSGPGLDDALLGDDPARAADMLVGLFETVGRMHALTLGQRARFEALRGPVEREPSTLQDEVTRALSRLDIEPAPGFFA